VASQSYRVAIVGGGLGGLTAALSARCKGISVTVLDQATELGEIGARIRTAPNASRILVGLGLRERLDAIHTEPLDQVRHRWWDGRIVVSTSLGEYCKNKCNAPYWHYHRADLHKVLLDACVEQDGYGPVVEVRTSCRVVDIDRTDSPRPVAVTAAGECHEADVLIGADGIRSTIRDAIGFSRYPSFFRRNGLSRAGSRGQDRRRSGNPTAGGPLPEHDLVRPRSSSHALHDPGRRVAQRGRDRAVAPRSPRSGPHRRWPTNWSTPSPAGTIGSRSCCRRPRAMPRPGPCTAARSGVGGRL
jgi:2-polyprenyl-6-methoxyphenol hydroxylase-like FAD-dependent oxidoreductase